MKVNNLLISLPLIRPYKGKPMTHQTFIPCLNPATGQQFDQVPESSPAMVQQAYQEMRQALPVWQGKSVKKRVRVLRQFQALLIDAADEITTVINQDCGKSRQDALIEVFMTVDMLNYYCRKAPGWLARQPVQRGLATLFKRTYIEHRPRGVVGIISPWNYPLNLALGPTLTALLAGNTVLLKPSEVTAATGKLMESLFSRVPELSPYVRVLHGAGATGAALVDIAPDYIFLTGSGPTAQKIQVAAAKNLTPVGFELGGKDATIVLDDADIEQAAHWVVWGGCFNAGQTCMAVERVYVLESVYDHFVQQAVQEAQRLKQGYNSDPQNPNHLGPITMPAQLDIIESHLQDALDKGAQVLIGGQRTGMFFEPTVLVNVDHTMRIMKEETFGPTIPIMKVKDEVEAIALANDSSFGLGGSVWSRNVAKAERVAHQIQASTLLINDALIQFAIPSLPFGGVKQSGGGRTHGQAGLLEFTQPYAYAAGRSPHPLDLGTVLRQPDHYNNYKTVIHLAFGTTPEQKLKPITNNLAVPATRKAIAAGLLGVVFSLLLWRTRR